MALDKFIIATAIPKIISDFVSLDEIGWYGSGFEGLRNEQLLLDAEADELQRHAKNLAEEHRLSRKWRNPAAPNLVRVFPLF